MTSAIGRSSPVTRVGEQLGERAAGQSFALGDRLLDRLDRVAVILRGRDVPAELELRPVVGDTADPPDTAMAGLELAEVELPDLVRPRRRHHERRPARLGQLPPFRLVVDRLARGRCV